MLLTKKNVDDGFKKLFAVTIEELTEKDASDLVDDFVYINDFVSEMLSEALTDEKFKKLLIFLHENVKTDLDKMNIDIENIAKKLETGLSNINASLKVKAIEKMWLDRLKEIYKVVESLPGDLDNIFDELDEDDAAGTKIEKASALLDNVIEVLGEAAERLGIDLKSKLEVKAEEVYKVSLIWETPTEEDPKEPPKDLPETMEIPKKVYDDFLADGGFDGDSPIIADYISEKYLWMLKEWELIEDKKSSSLNPEAGCDTKEEKESAKYKAIQKNKEKDKKKKKAGVEIPEIKTGTRDELLKVEAVLKERMPGITAIDLGRAMREVITAAKKNITDPKVLQRLRTAEINNMFPEFDKTGGVWKVEKDENGKETIIRPDIQDIESAIMNKGCIHKVGDALTYDQGGEKGKMIEVQVKELLDGGRYRVKAFTNGKEYETDDKHLFTQKALEEQYG